MTIDLKAELAQYIETALWASHDESTPDGGEPMDANYGPEDLAPETVDTMRADLEAFMSSVDPAMLELWQSELGDGQVGHDFWLTRNGHGAGFWDRFSAGVNERIGRTLTDAAHACGECDLYVGDDGRLYV